MEHVIPSEVMPILIALAAYVLLAHNMLFTLNYSWMIQKRAFINSFFLAVIAVLIRLGKIHFMIAGMALLIFYHIFEGLFFHKLEKLSKEILQKYLLMGVIGMLVIIGSFDKDYSGLVQVPDEQYARISYTSLYSGINEGTLFAISAGLVTLALFLSYILLSKRVARLADQQEKDN
jgi:hypothetical protein